MKPHSPTDMTPESIARENGLDLEDLNNLLDIIHRSMQIPAQRVFVQENGLGRYFMVELKGVGKITTPYGKFWEYDFRIDDEWRKYSVILKGEIDEETFLPIFKNDKELVLRTDSGCETGQVFNDMTCECGDQLDLAMKTIAEVGEGMIIHIPRQDGRGMGLPFKLATLWLQDEFKINTVEAACLLAPGGVIDVRTYTGVICILKFFQVSTECHIKLATNNPKKAEVFQENGYIIPDYVPVIIEPNENTRRHLTAKQDCLGHIGLVHPDIEEQE